MEKLRNFKKENRKNEIKDKRTAPSTAAAAETAVVSSIPVTAAVAGSGIE
jgi:hypothetical protein